MRAPYLLLSLLFSCITQGQLARDAKSACSKELLTESAFAAALAAPSEAQPMDPALLAPEATTLPERTLQASAMEGPYDSIEDYCEWLFRTSERFNPVSNENNCSYTAQRHAKGAQLIYASTGDAGRDFGGEYHVALKTRDGWFVSDEQYLDDISGGAAGSFYEATLSRPRLSVEDLIPGGQAEVVLRANKRVSRLCTACDAAAERRTARPLSNQEQLIACSVEGAQPSCVAFSSPREDDGRATKLSLSFSADAVTISSATLFSISREHVVEGQYHLAFP